jgi:PAS domain S-box-containing protein
MSNEDFPPRPAAGPGAARPPRLDTAGPLAPGWRVRLAPPSSLLARVRWIFLGLALAAIVVTAPLVVAVTAAGWELRALAGGALVGLAACWVGRYRGAVSRLPWLVLESGALLLVGLAAFAPLAVRPLLMAGLMFRSLYGSARTVAAGALVYTVVFLAAAAWSPQAPLAAIQGPQVLGAIPGFLLAATVMHLVARSVQKYEAGQAEIERLNADLERRVQERTVALETANRELGAEIAERRAIETALRESEARYRTVVETSPDAIVLTDLQANVLLCNEGAAALIGYESAAAMIGRSAFTFIAPGDLERAQASLQRVLTAGSVKQAEHVLLRTDGATLPAEVSASLLVDAAGRPQGLVAVVRDVSERNQADAELWQARQVEARLEGVVLASREVGHLLNNDLAVAIGALELVEAQADLPPRLRALLADLNDGLASAAEHVRQFQQVGRVEIKDTPQGPALDLERSTQAEPGA